MFAELRKIVEEVDLEDGTRRLSFMEKPTKQQVKELMKYMTKKQLTIDELLKTFYLYYDQSGIHDYLINKLYSYSEGEINFYITQICYLTIEKGSHSLEKFLVDMSAKSTSLYFLIKAVIEAYSVAVVKSAEDMKKLEDLKRDIEESYVNGASSRSIIIPNKDKNVTDVIRQAIQKEARSDYNKLNNEFLTNMVDYSLILKSIDLKDQKEKLQGFMVKENIWIKQVLRKNNKDDQFQGITIPFRMNKRDKYNSNLVVRIIPDEVSCFNTRTRVPYRAVLETIDISDLGKYHKKESLISDETTEAIQNEMQDIRKQSSALKHFLTPKTQEEVIQNKINKYASLQEWAKVETEKENQDNLSKLADAAGQTPKNAPNLVLEPQQSSRELLQEMKNKFNEKFPSSNGRLQRRNSVDHTQLQQTKKKNILGTGFFKRAKKRSKSQRELKNKDIVEFLQKTFSSSSQKGQKLGNIVQFLQKQQKSFRDVEERDSSDFPRKLPPWGEFWEDKKIIIRQSSPYGHFKSYKVRAVMFKGGDDLRQEILAMQLISKFQSIFQNAGLRLWLKPYEILVISSSSGILEFLPDTHSIDGLKKKVQGFTSLEYFYRDCFGDEFETAQKNFIESLAGYSIVSYLLQFKDRHNGNIMIQNTGHLIHIDFGFMFSISPGNLNWENAPFKLTKEYVQLMGGLKSDYFSYYKDLLFMGFQAIIPYVDEIVFLIQIMREKSDLPCFRNFDLSVFVNRFREDLKDNDKGLRQYVEKLVNDSYDNNRTNLYDYFQLKTNKIRP